MSHPALKSLSNENPINVAGVIKLVLFKSSTITVFILRSGSDEVKIKTSTNLLIHPNPGEFWSVEGSYTESDLYGAQLVITKARRVLPLGECVLDFLCHHIPSLSFKERHRLRARFGSNLDTVLNSESLHLLTSKKGGAISASLGSRMLSIWENEINEMHISDFLYKNNIVCGSERTIYNHFGKYSIQFISTNPYCLLSLFDFDAIDPQIVAGLRISTSDTRRLVGAAVECCYRNYSAGNTAIHQDIFLAKVSDRLGGSLELASLAVECALSQGFIHQSDNYIQLIAHLNHEKFICHTLRDKAINISLTLERVSSKTEYALSKADKTSSLTENIVNNTIKNGFSFFNYTKIEELFCVSRTIQKILKTRSIAFYQFALSSENCKFYEQAFDEKIDLIGSLGTASFREWPDDCWFIVYDSTSLCITSITWILRAIPATGRIVFLGNSKLPLPLGSGSLFHAFSESPFFEVVNGLSTATTDLTELYESLDVYQPTNAMRRNSIAKIDSINIVRAACGIFYQLRQTGLSIIISTNHHLISEINKDLQQNFAALEGGLLANEPRSFTCFLPGDPIFCKKTISEKSLLAGQFGKVVNCYGSQKLSVDVEGNQVFIVAEVDFGNGCIGLTEKEIAYFQLAYAVAPNEIQANLFSNVILLTSENSLASEAVLWLARSAAIDRLVLLGNTDFINPLGAYTDYPLERCTGMAAHIRETFNA